MASRGEVGAGDRRELADVLRAHVDGLYGYCHNLEGNSPDAEDLLQTTLLRAVRGWPGLRDHDRARAWLFTIARNTWRDRGRAAARQVPTIPPEVSDADGEEFSLYEKIAIEDPFPYSDEVHLDFMRLFRSEDVQAILASIPETFREPLILTLVHGFPCKDAARILDVPLGTVLSRVHRARKRIEQGLWTYAVEKRLVTVADEEDEG